MKLILIILFSVLSLNCFSQFQLGENVGFYSNGYTDQQLYDLMAKGKATSTRSNVSIQQYLQFGMATFHDRLIYPFFTKGLTNNVFNLYSASTIQGGSNYTGRSSYVTSPGGNQSWLMAGIDSPVFNIDSSVHSTNIAAVYFDSVARSIGAAFGIYEVLNEPDLSFGDQGYEDSTQTGDSWQKFEPKPDDNPNMYDSLEKYIKLCKIASLVIKHRFPNAKIATGGIGYKWWYMWFIRKGGQQWVDYLSWHGYPYFDWTSFPNIVHRNSDWAVYSMDTLHFYALRQMETQEHGTHLPAILTESNIPRWSTSPSDTLFPYNRYFGNDRIQRNYTIKLWATLMQHGLKYMYLYQLGETADSPLNNGSAGDEIDRMGMWKDLQRSTHGAEVLTQAGVAIRTMNDLLHNYTVSTTTYVSPAGTKVVELDSGTYKAYIAWAITTQDTSEVASANIITPGNNSFVSYNYDQSSNGTVSGALALTGDPVILMPAGAPIIITPPGGTCNCMQLNAKLKQAR